MILHNTFSSHLDKETWSDEDPQDFPNIDVSLLRISRFFHQLFFFLIFTLVVIKYTIFIVCKVQDSQANIPHCAVVFHGHL